MCRIFFLKTKNKDIAEKLLKSWKLSAQEDPYLEKIAKKFNIKGIKNKHKHGWGYLLLTKDKMFIYKTEIPIYKDKEFNKLISLIKKIEGEFLIIGLARVTDIGYISSIESHPFSFLAKNKENRILEVYLAYNGLFNAKKACEIFGICKNQFDERNTALALSYTLMKYLETMDFREAMLKATELTNSGLNLFTLVLDKDIKAYLMAFAKEELLKNELTFNYYSLAKNINNEFIFAGNKLIADYAREKYKIDGFKLMENKEIIEINIDFVNKEFFNGYL
jgi:glutamine amidotransferase